MQRRKMLAALGSAAVGGATAMGTGAFTSVTADRSVDVAVAGDSDALLTVQEVSGSANSKYVTIESDGTLSIDISTKQGKGLNEDATTKIKDLFQIRNRGTQDVYVWISGTPGPDSDGNFPFKFAVQDNSKFRNKQGNKGALSLNSNLNPDDLDDDQDPKGSAGYEAAPKLAPGDYVNVELFSYGDVDFDFDDTITINAKDADQVD